MEETRVVLETERLLIRRYKEDDLEELAAIVGDAETMKFWPAPFTREQAEAWLERSFEANRTWGFGRWAMVLRETGKIIGDVGFMQAELAGQMENDLGYILAAEYWGQNLGTEAAAACLNYGFRQLGMTRICANMAVDHHASRRVAEKIGMTVEKQYINKRNRDKLTYLLSKSI
ncbi:MULTISPECIES: GNAT family N-acetyltransferase [Paenibacillus]|uniref:GNAT family N-acetyltransferase n=1 Tax=Paenibacillus TaxID=44249 RepID=UPI002FDFAF29